MFQTGGIGQTASSLERYLVLLTFSLWRRAVAQAGYSTYASIFHRMSNVDMI